MQELSFKSVKVGNCFEGHVQCPLLYDNAASLCVYPESRTQAPGGPEAAGGPASAGAAGGLAPAHWERPRKAVLGPEPDQGLNGAEGSRLPPGTGDLPVSVWEPPAKALIGGGLLQGWGHGL